jgi:hypothetical protein
MKTQQQLNFVISIKVQSYLIDLNQISFRFQIIDNNYEILRASNYTFKFHLFAETLNIYY